MSEEAATFALAAAIDKLADATVQHALAIAARAAAPSPAASSGAPPAPPAAGGPPGGAGGREKTTEEKMAGKVFAICKQQGWDIGDVGQRATGRPIGADSRKWSKDDLVMVLEAMKEWGFP